MKTDRKWIVLALALTAALVLTGCPKKAPAPEPVEPPPPVVTPPPVEDVSPAPVAPMTDDTEKQPPMSIQELEEEARRGGLLGDVFYEFDQYDLRADARERLAKNAEWMLSPEGREFTFKIEGHCDERGTNEYNIALGENRSTTALDYLVSLGVPRGRFQTVSFGEERPFCTESTEACWQRNRRAHFVITGRG